MDIPTEKQLDAVRQVELVRRRLGARDFAIVYAVVVEDISWRQLARRLRCDQRTAKKKAIAAIKRLAKVSGGA